MKKKIFSYNKKKLRRLPQIQGSSINLSINNTYVLIKNQTPDNYSFIKKDILPNIFSYNTKRKNNILSPIKKIKKKDTPNIHTFKLIKTETVINEKKSPEDLFLTHKFLNRMIWFFNIRELLIYMNINRKVNSFIKQTPIFQKYINIKNDFKNGYFFSNLNKTNINTSLKNTILKNANDNIQIQINTESNKFNFNNNIFDNKNINSFIKYNLINKKKIKLKKVLNQDILSFNKISLNANTSNNIINNDNIDKQKYAFKIKNTEDNIFINNSFENLNNSLISSKTGSSKNENICIEKISKNGDSKNDVSNYNKIKSDFLNLIKNNGNKIQLMMKKYKLTHIESKIILNGIIETILLKKQIYEKENNKNNNFLSSLVLKNIKADKYMVYYIDPILNLEFEDIMKIHFDNIVISSINIMKKICNILSRNFTYIKILSLQNNDINDKCAKILFLSLKYNKALTILNLDHNQISSKSIIYGDLFFKYNNTLNTLVLSYNYLGPNGSNYLLSYLKSNKKSVLRTLDISYNGISIEGVNSLVEYIKSYEKLLSLFFAGNCLEDKGIGLFVKLLLNESNNIFNNIKLSYLDLSNNNLTKNSCKYLNNIISLSSFISNINIGYNSFFSEGINSIFSFINIKNKLVSLDVSQTNINEKCIKYISEYLDKNLILRILNLSYNNLNKACKYLNNLLIKETNIKVIKLISCKINENINIIFQGLSINNSIETFDISGNNINLNYNLLNDILIFFKENKKIINLILDNNNIDDFGINIISQGIELNHSIKKLSLKNNYITDENIISLINSAKNNNIIRKIDLDGNGISKKNKENLYKLLSDKLQKQKIFK